MQKFIIIAVTIAVMVINVSAQKGRSYVNPALSPGRKAFAKSPTRPLVPPPRISQTPIDSNSLLSTAQLRPAAPAPVPAPVKAIGGTKLPRPNAAVAAPVPRRPIPSRPIVQAPAPAPAIKIPVRPSTSAAVAAPVRDRDDDNQHPAPEPYSFSYAVNDEESGAQLTREERQDAGGNIVGFYHIMDAEGRRRRVDYTAGPDGFKATISSNEEGLINRDSADAAFSVEEVPEERQNSVAASAQAAARGRPQA
nr:translation initiation factor IF-2-like [Dermatophagoides farinae]